MPSTMTHTYFAKDTYTLLPSFCKELVDLEDLKLFSQGADPFMFYQFFIGPSSKKGKKVQYQIHASQTQKFFLSIITYINNHNLKNNPQIIAYLYGYICHYQLDRYAHPYIYYKSGKFDPNNLETYPYNTLHQKIEYQIDKYFIQKREKIPPHQFKIHKEIFTPKPFSRELKEVIKNTIGSTYSIKNAPTLYSKSIHHMKIFYRLVNYDPTGIKFQLYKCIDKITGSKAIRLSVCSYYSLDKNINTYLNLNNHTWNTPWDLRKTDTSSFLDLYKKALKDTIYTIKEVTKMLESQKIDKKKLKKLFPNLSLVTGENCSKKLEMKYFDKGSA